MKSRFFLSNQCSQPSLPNYRILGSIYHRPDLMRGCTRKLKWFQFLTQTFATPFLIEGIKFDLSSILSQSFQSSHSFACGSKDSPSNYHFGAGYSSPEILLHGLLDHDGNLQARANYNWIPQALPEQPKVCCKSCGF
jgi:Eukaryotic porin